MSKIYAQKKPHEAAGVDSTHQTAPAFSNQAMLDLLKAPEHVQAKPLSQQMNEKLSQHFGVSMSGLKVFEKQIIYILRKMPIIDIAALPDVTEGLENRIKAAANSSNNLEELISKIKTKRFTQSRIQRILLYALIGITNRDMEMSKKTLPYIRVLGFNKHGKRIISSIAENNPKAKIVVSVKRFIENNKDPKLQTLMNKDIAATNIYTLGYKNGNGIANLDYTHKVLEIR